jgi:glycosyltransferase involved in cell wall biosynthesis
MKVVIVNAVDIEGGAARSAYRLHKGLQGIDVESLMFVMTKKSSDHTVVAPRSPFKRLYSMLGPYIDVFPVVYLYRPSAKPIWSTNWFPNNVLPYINKLNPDIVHLRWVGGGFLNLSALPKIKRPIVWTLPDSWPFTGGCHVPFDCTRYVDACGACPQLESRFQSDLSRYVHKKKAKAYRSTQNLTVVCGGRWLADCAQKSSLLKNFRVEVIPPAVDHTLYRPMDKNLSRELLGLPKDKRLILFGAMNSTTDKNKGFHFLVQALREISGSLKDTELVVFGGSEPEEPLELGFRPNYMGTLNDDVSIVLLYSAADVMVVPSMQEAFGMTAMEAMACGTPVVAFGATGLLDVVEHERTGYLAEPYEPEGLAKGIEWVLSDEARYAELSNNARRRVEEEFTLEICARRYLELYRELL